MKWLGVLIICAVVALLLCIAAWFGKGHKWSVMIGTYIMFTAFLFVLTVAVMFGISLIIGG